MCDLQNSGLWYCVTDIWEYPGIAMCDGPDGHLENPGLWDGATNNKENPNIAKCVMVMVFRKFVGYENGWQTFGKILLLPGV